MSKKRKISTKGGEPLGENPFTTLDGNRFLRDEKGPRISSPQNNSAKKKSKGRVEIRREKAGRGGKTCLLYTSPSPRDRTRSRMPSSA